MYRMPSGGKEGKASKILARRGGGACLSILDSIQSIARQGLAF